MIINLLPWRERQARRNLNQFLLLLLISEILITVLTVSIRGHLNQLRKASQSRNRIEATQLNPIPINDDNKKLSVEYQILQQQIQLIQNIRIYQNNFWQEFAFLQQHLSDDIQLNYLTWSGQTLTLQGLSDHSEKITLLVQTLEKSQLFSQVILDALNREEMKSRIHFSLHLECKNENST